MRDLLEPVWDEHGQEPVRLAEYFSLETVVGKPILTMETELGGALLATAPGKTVMTRDTAHTGASGRGANEHPQRVYDGTPFERSASYARAIRQGPFIAVSGTIAMDPGWQRRASRRCLPADTDSIP